METQTLDCGFELKAEAMTADGSFEGFAAVFGNRDSMGDVIERGAFAGTKAKSVRMLWQHNSAMPIGVWDKFEEQDKGLLAQGRLITGSTNGRDAYELMKAGAIDGLSIGYSVVDSEVDAKRGIRKIKSVNLWEVSPVTFPANDKARVHRVKSLRPEAIASKRELEDALRDEGFSKSDAAYVVSLTSLPARRDAGGDTGLQELLAEGQRVATILKG